MLESQEGDEDTTKMGSASAADTLNEMVGDRPPTLTSLAGWDAIVTLTSHLPAPLVSKFYLECHLAASARRTDLIIGFENEGRDILAGTNPVLHMATARNDLVDSATRELCQRWAQAETPLTGVYRGWLEFDLPPSVDGADLPSPGLFLDFELDTRIASVLSGLQSERCLESLLGPSAGAIWDQAASCIAALPANAFTCSIGLFPARARDQIRICVADLRAEDCATFLRAVGWPGRMDSVQTWLHRLATRQQGWPPSERVALHLDVGQRVGPNLGIECRLDRGSQLAGSLREDRFLDALVTEGLCSFDEGRGLRGWPGTRLGSLPSTLWRSVVIRRVNHIKLCFGPEINPAAKAYLSIHAQPWRVRSKGTPPSRGHRKPSNSPRAVNKMP